MNYPTGLWLILWGNRMSEGDLHTIHTHGPVLTRRDCLDLPVLRWDRLDLTPIAPELGKAVCGVRSGACRTAI